MFRHNKTTTRGEAGFRTLPQPSVRFMRLCTAALLASALTACGGGDSSPASGSTNNIAPPASGASEAVPPSGGGGGGGGGGGANTGGDTGGGTSGGSGTGGGTAGGGGTSGGGGTTGGGGDTGGGVTPPPKGDPLAEYEWYLKNTGQTAFSGKAGTPGVDLDVASLFDQGETGNGVRVLVVDTGVDIGHPDLKDRIDPALLYNFSAEASSTTDPTPSETTADVAHGTAVAGIIGASANKGFGVRGVAPEVRLGGALLICSTCYSIANTLAAYGGASFSQNADVMNASYGRSPTSVLDFDPSSSPEAIGLQQLPALRNGKGIVFVKSAGNNFQQLAGRWCRTSVQAKVTCGNASIEPVNTMPQALVVAAVNANGVKASYSSGGSAILVSGLGGEYGVELQPDTRWGPAIMTTDLSGCNRGVVQTGTPSDNPFNDPTTPTAQSLNPLCNYTATMNGTSAATPTVTGVVALMLHANPQLTWRDVRFIISATARQIDAQRVPQSVTLPSGETYVPEPAWTRNGAGRWFDNYYGFGLVDAAAAVAMAKSYTSYLTGPMASATAAKQAAGCGDFGSADAGSCGDIIPLGEANGVTETLSLSGQNVHSIEALQMVIQLGGVTMSDIAIELISPAGTRSVLFNAFNGMRSGAGNVRSLTLASNAFNGESAGGNWQLRVIDVAHRRNLQAGTFQGVKLNVMGH